MLVRESKRLGADLEVETHEPLEVSHLAGEDVPAAVVAASISTIAASIDAIGDIHVCACGRYPQALSSPCHATPSPDVQMRDDTANHGRG